MKIDDLRQETKEKRDEVTFKRGGQLPMTLSRFNHELFEDRGTTTGKHASRKAALTNWRRRFGEKGMQATAELWGRARESGLEVGSLAIGFCGVSSEMF